jgi:hypothetical protein
MARSLSLNFREAINAAQSGEVPIWLVTMDHDDLVGETIRMSSDPTERITEIPLTYGTVSGSFVFLFTGMSVQLPDESADAAPRSTLVMSNVSRDAITLVRSVVTPARCKIELVLSSDPDFVEVSSPWLDVLDARVSAQNITVDLGLNSMITQSDPGDSFDPAGFPGLFG